MLCLARRMMLLLGRFRGERSGNIAVTFTLALIPILSGVGYAIDYAMTMRIEARLQSAADAARVAAASQQSPGYTASLSMISDGNVPAGATDANNIFTAIAALSADTPVWRSTPCGPGPASRRHPP